MGLKESGLRGSLRNTSSVLPAFFDVTITNTNSPVQEGDILTVDYSADNTGDAQDTQDIRLEIDSVQEDVDPDVMLAGGASTTGTLEWDTTDEDEAEYTATVLSDDDSDSVTVEIEAAIPDTAKYQLNALELTGFSDNETVNNWPELVTDTDVSGEGTYQSSKINGNAAVVLDGSSSNVFRDTGFDDITGEATFFFVLENDATDDSRILYGEDNFPQLRAEDRGYTYVDSGGATNMQTDTDLSEQLVVYRLNEDNGEGKIRVDGSEEASTSSGIDEIPGMIELAQNSSDGPFEGGVGMFEPHDEFLSDSDVQDRESEIADMFDIDLS